jgi:putative ABC transport system permease protein
VRLHLPLAVAVGVKDVFARRGRAILTVASLALTVAMAMQVLQLEALVRTTAAKDLFREEPYDVQVQSPYLKPPAVERLLAHRSQIRAAATLTWRQMRVAGAPPGSPMYVRALSGDYAALDYHVEAGRLFSAPGEAVLADAAFGRYGLRIGDRVRLRDGGRTMTVRIVGRYADNDNDGLMLMTSLATLRRSEPRAQPDTYGIQLRDDRDAAALKSALVRDSRQRLEVTVTPTGDPEANRIRRIVYVLCAVLLLVGVVNLLTTTLLGVRERVRDFGILKSIGLTPRQLVVAVTAGGALLALLAAAVGMPAGVGLYRGLVAALADPSERSALTATPAWWWMALLVPATLLFAAVGTALPARRAADVDVAAALRYE